MPHEYIVGCSNLYANTIESVAWKTDVAWRCDAFGAAHMHMLHMLFFVIYRGWWNRGCLEDDRNAPTSVTSLCEFPDLLCTARWLGCTAPSKKCKKGVLWSHWFCCRSRRWNVSPWFRWMILTHRASWSVVLSKIKSLLQWGDLRQTRTSYYGTLLKFVKFGHGCS